MRCFKKNLLVAIFLVIIFSPNAFCQLSPRLDSLKVYVTDWANIPSTGSRYWTDAKLTRVINKAIQRVCSEFPAIEKFDTVTVDSIPEGGALNSDFDSIKNVFYVSGDTLRIPLQLINNGDSLFVDNPTIERNKQDTSDILSPRSYHVHGNRLILHPKWFDGTDGIFLVEYFAVDSILNAAASQTQIKPRFRCKIIDFAVEDILGRRK